MQAAVTVTPARIPELLLGLATVRPVFLWGAPGIGKSSLVRKFADSLGLDCVSLIGTQLAPEDLIGVPQIRDGRSVFCPPEAIARDEAYCLFLDELNAATPDVQKAFYSLILDRRIGTYELPEGSIVIGAGNRATDNALARPMASALVNRLAHVHLEASATDWLVWAGEHGIHSWVTDYLTDRPDHLWAKPPKTEEPFSTPRSWHMLSDALHSFGPALDDATLKTVAHGTLTPAHAVSFCGYVKIVRHEFYRRGLQRGLDLHERDQGRGLLPAGLIEEIRALAQPPLPWDALLARWFDEFVPRAEPVRTFARPAHAAGRHPRHPARGPLLPARGGRPLHLRRRPRHLRLHEPHAARQGAGGHRVVRGSA